MVNCQGLGNLLPDVSPINNPELGYDTVVCDELSYMQVISNKQFFQAGNDYVTLAQSNCNQHSYRIWPYGLKIIGCSNDFPMTVEEGVRSEQDAEWLRGNIVVVELPPKETWYLQSHAKPKPSFGDAYVSRVKAKVAQRGALSSGRLPSRAPDPVAQGGG